jgi:hypothetical protein
MPVVFSALFSTIGSFFTGMFQYKGAQAETVQKALETLRSIDATDAQATTAAAQALTQGSWLERNWRPWFMLLCMAIVIAFFFGYTPQHINDPMSPMMREIWDLLKIGLMGYLPLRSVDKLVQQLNIGSILKTLINKKVL